MNEQLIELVRTHTILYDTNDPNYFKGKLKDELWKDIGKELNLKSGKLKKYVILIKVRQWSTKFGYKIITYIKTVQTLHYCYVRITLKLSL